jgi:hypothetical protein
VLDPVLLKQFNTVHDALDGNKAFPTPPVDMASFKSGIDTIAVLVTDAEDGGKKAIAAKKKQREVMMKMITQLGHYVEPACNDDPAIFSTSGFTAVSNSRTPPQPLAAAAFEWIDLGYRTSRRQTQEDCQGTQLRRALRCPWRRWNSWTLDERRGSEGETSNHQQPDAGHDLRVPDPRVARLGYTDWSDSTTFICA